jgi:hypothetical protein
VEHVDEHLRAATWMGASPLPPGWCRVTNLHAGRGPHSRDRDCRDRAHRTTSQPRLTQGSRYIIERCCTTGCCCSTSSRELPAPTFRVWPRTLCGGSRVMRPSLTGRPLSSSTTAWACALHANRRAVSGLIAAPSSISHSLSSPSGPSRRACTTTVARSASRSASSPDEHRATRASARRAPAPAGPRSSGMTGRLSASRSSTFATSAPCRPVRSAARPPGRNGGPRRRSTTTRSGFVPPPPLPPTTCVRRGPPYAGSRRTKRHRPIPAGATRSRVWRTSSARPPCRRAARRTRAPRTCGGASRAHERRRSIVAPSTGTGRT